MSEACSHDCSSCGQECGDRSEPQSLLAQSNPDSHVKKVIGVVSGKGGVGKSMVTSLLASAMQKKGYNVAILDADITGPSIPRMFGLGADHDVPAPDRLQARREPRGLDGQDLLAVTDSMGANYNSTSPLSRSAPIPSYASSGPRQVSLTFDLHRDMMQQINYGVSNLDITIDDDYVDYLVKSLQACAVPQYKATQKMVNPPMVAVRLGNDIFIKGIVSGTVNVTYKLPVLENGKYACISVTFNVQEVDPYSADQIQSQGSYRGISKTLERRVYASGR